jgi:tellurite resistance-related uncharacterized protein
MGAKQVKNLPDDVAAYQRTKSFTQDCAPPGLLANHSTKEGVWRLIQAKKGQLEYTIDNNEVHILTPEKCGVVEPTVTHHVRPLGEVLFSVEFYR